jgi:hypothetical protein
VLYLRVALSATIMCAQIAVVSFVVIAGRYSVQASVATS